MEFKEVEPRCPYFGTCGGCQLQHLSYERQLLVKQELVKSCLAKEGLGGVPVAATVGMDDPWFYRNKIQFPIRAQNNRLQMGYFKRRTHEVVNIKECYIQDPYLTEIAQLARGIFEERGLSGYDEKSGEGLLRHFIGRSSGRTNEMLLGMVINGKGIPAAFSVADEIKKRERKMHQMVARHREYEAPKKKMRIVGVVQNINTGRNNVILGQHNTSLFGNGSMREKLNGFVFQLQLPSFFQINPIQAEKLYDRVRGLAELSGTETVVDAYAGIGTIAFWLSAEAAKVIAIEERKEATRDAARSLALNKINNIEIVTGMAEKVFPKKADVIVLDPPRGGCSLQVLRSAVKARPRKMLYVSCNPETLARDLKELSTAGYETKNVTPVDMFPQTEHVEAVAEVSLTG